jgi:hypothetical protein
MALTFQQIPDWTSSENQGGGVAVADVDRDGAPDLVVLRVDRPADGGPNHGFYRVGRRLDSTGSPTAGWGPWIEIPNWSTNENQGAGIAIADFGAAGLGLVVFQVQHVVPGPNRGLFRIGRTLDAQGTVTGGWTDWQQVPDWRSWRDQGAAIAVADIGNNGSLDLVVFHIDDFHTDNPGRPNKGFYRVGGGLLPDGQVTAWTDWIDVDWFSWFNQGAGVAIADLDGNGLPEIIIFHIDNPRGNPPQENVGWCRVGWNLNAEGGLRDGWGPWTRFDGWGSVDDQGGGLALAPLGSSRPKVVVFDVEHTPAPNQGRFAVADLALDIDTAATKGVWRLLPYLSEVLPVHAALLHTGKVLFFAGSGNNAFRFNSPKFGDAGHSTSVVWDPTKSTLDTSTFEHPPTLHRGDGSVIDFFCCGHAFLKDGRILTVGGTGEYDKVLVNGQMQDAGHGFAGIRDTAIFDPLSRTWRPGMPTSRGRWYPTVIGLGDGDVLAASGLDEQAQGLDNNTLEVNADPAHVAWAFTRDFNLPLYPHLFQLVDGRLFHTGGKMDTPGDSVPLVFDPLVATPAVVIGGLIDPSKCNQCASVVLPPAQDQKFMILGGGPEDPDDPAAPRGIATKRTAIVDFGSAGPTYADSGALNHERMHVNAVILPDRTVVAVGGGVTREASARTKVVDPQNGHEVFEAEIFDPHSNNWTITAPATVARLYHSVALLLPDGRVVSAGGNPDKGTQVDWLPPDPDEEMRLEIFSPPYLFKKSTRPAVQSVQAELQYGSEIDIQTPQASEIEHISLIRPGLTTHSFNGPQRLIDMPFVPAPPNALRATAPSDRNLAPPGWYMLFLTDTEGVPSVASWIHLS